MIKLNDAESNKDQSVHKEIEEQDTLCLMGM